MVRANICAYARALGNKTKLYNTSRRPVCSRVGNQVHLPKPGLSDAALSVARNAIREHGRRTTLFGVDPLDAVVSSSGDRIVAAERAGEHGRPGAPASGGRGHQFGHRFRPIARPLQGSLHDGLRANASSTAGPNDPTGFFEPVGKRFLHRHLRRRQSWRRAATAIHRQMGYVAIKPQSSRSASVKLPGGSIWLGRRVCGCPSVVGRRISRKTFCFARKFKRDANESRSKLAQMVDRLGVGRPRRCMCGGTQGRIATDQRSQRTGESPYPDGKSGRAPASRQGRQSGHAGACA
jgi:hypothetical protein